MTRWKEPLDLPHHRNGQKRVADSSDDRHNKPRIGRKRTQGDSSVGKVRRWRKCADYSKGVLTLHRRDRAHLHLLLRNRNLLKL
jgi:hypothetical protein